MFLVLAALLSAAAALPVGSYVGYVRIVPYQQSGSGYQCLNQCSYVQSNAALTWFSSNLLVNISAGRNPQGCTLSAQTYTITNVNVHQRLPYYGGMLSVQSQTIPVCFVFDSINFIITLDGAGTCPYQSDPPSCTQAGLTVVQTWTGSFNYYPSGTWTGRIGILPYQQRGATYTCLTQCSPIYTTSTLSFYGSTLTISISSGSSPQGCTLNAQSYTVTGVVFHAVNYYGGTFYVSPTQTINVCMYFNPSDGAFVIALDGLGTCPPATSGPTCFPGPSGTVKQVWTGQYRTTGAVAEKPLIE